MVNNPQGNCQPCLITIGALGFGLVRFLRHNIRSDFRLTQKRGAALVRIKQGVNHFNSPIPARTVIVWYQVPMTPHPMTTDRKRGLITRPRLYVTHTLF